MEDCASASILHNFAHIGPSETNCDDLVMVRLKLDVCPRGYTAFSKGVRRFHSSLDDI